MFPVTASEVCLSWEKTPTNPLEECLNGWNNYAVMLYVDFMTWEKCRKINYFIEPECSTKWKWIWSLLSYILPLSAMHYFPVHFCSLLVKGESLFEYDYSLFFALGKGFIPAEKKKPRGKSCLNFQCTCKICGGVCRNKLYLSLRKVGRSQSLYFEGISEPIDVRSEITGWCHVVITGFEMWIHFNILLVYTRPKKNWKLNTSNLFSHSC